MGRREAETRARSGPRLVVYFPREHFFFFPLLEKVFCNSAGYYWQAGALLPVEAWTGIPETGARARMWKVCSGDNLPHTLTKPLFCGLSQVQVQQGPFCFKNK